MNLQVKDSPDNESDEKDKSDDDSSPKEVNTVRQHVNTASPKVNTGHFKLNIVDPSVNTASSYALDSPKDMFNMGDSHILEATYVEFFSDEDEPEVDLGNILNSYTVPTTPNTKIHKDHPIKNVIGDVKSFIQTRMTKPTYEQGFLSDVYEQKIHDTLNTCLYACFLSQIEPTSIAKALSNSSWVEAMQEELLQFKLQQVWILVDLPIGKRAIGTKWVFRTRKVKEGLIEAIRLFLAYASFMDFLIYQMDIKSAFLYGTIEEEVYVTQPTGFKDPDHPDKVYKVVKALYGFHQALRAWYETLANYLLGNGFKRGKIDQTLFIKKQKENILLVQVYVDDIIFGSTNKELCTTFEKLIKDKKALVKDGDADDVDVHLYRSMIGSLMYLTTSRPNIMFACKKQTVVATSKTEANKMAAASFVDKDKQIEYLMLNASPLKHVKRGQDTKIPQSSGPPVKVGDEAVHKELGDRIERAATTASSLEAEQDSDAQTRFETTSKQSNDQPLSRVNTLGSGEDSMKLIELMVHCTTLSELNLNSLSIHQMASLEFCDKHNMVAYLEKSEGSEGFHQIIDFLTASHIKNALTECPTLYASPIEQFWQTAALSTNEDGVRGITSTIDRKVKVFVSEASIRRHLKLEDSEGLKTLPTAEIFKQLALMGFIQIFLNKRKGMLFPHKKTFPTPTLTQKLFSNMKRATKGYSGVDIPLFPTMLTTPESSPSRITSSPSLSPQTHPSTSQPPSNQTTPVTEEAAPMPYKLPLQSVHSLGRDEGSLSLNELTDLCTSLYKKVEILESELKETKQTYNAALTKLIKRVKKLEQTIKTSQARRRAKVVIFDDEEAEEDPSNQGRSLIEELDLDAGISLVPPHAPDQGRIDDTQISDQPEEQLGVFSATKILADAAEQGGSVENVQTYTRRRREVSTGSGGVSTANRLVSTADISTAS
ncbi:putative ribonuclease H-like domain-containing protein [Tanacetum coccineum]